MAPINYLCSSPCSISSFQLERSQSDSALYRTHMLLPIPSNNRTTCLCSLLPAEIVRCYFVRNSGKILSPGPITGGRKQGTVFLHGWLWLLPTSTPSQMQASSTLTRSCWGKKATSLLKANFPLEKLRNEDALWTLLQPRIKVLKWNWEMLKVLHRNSPKAKKQSSQLYWGIICLILRREIP